MHPLYLLLILHFIADGVLQPRWMAIKKSNDIEVLYMHVSIIYIVITLGMLFIVPIKSALMVGVVNAFLHGIIDGSVWNGFKAIKKFQLIGIGGNLTHQEKLNIMAAYKPLEDHLFFTTILFDQMLHALTLVFVWRLFV